MKRIITFFLKPSLVSLFLILILPTLKIIAEQEPINPCEEHSDSFKTYDMEKWQDVLLYSQAKGAVSVKQGELFLSTPQKKPTEIEVYSLFSLIGDFDLQIDYHIYQNNNHRKCRFNSGIVMQTLDDEKSYKFYVSEKPGKGLLFTGRHDIENKINKEKLDQNNTMQKNISVLIGLDRDGTINYDPGYFGRNKNWKNQLQILPFVVQGLERIKKRIPNSKLIVMTNQAGVARGYFSEQRVFLINNEINIILKNHGINIDKFINNFLVSKDYAREKGLSSDNPYIDRTSPTLDKRYLDPGFCLNRKPNIGMFEQAAEFFGLNLSDIKYKYMIGDKYSDILFGLNANGKSIYIRNSQENNNKDTYDNEMVIELRKKFPERVFIVDNFFSGFRESCG